MVYAIHIERHVKETEKAICVTAKVTFNGNKAHERDIWLPKSVVTEIYENSITVKDWFVNKLEWQNAFKGYAMRFAYKFAFEN